MLHQLSYAIKTHLKAIILHNIFSKLSVDNIDFTKLVFSFWIFLPQFWPGRPCVGRGADSAGRDSRIVIFIRMLTVTPSDSPTSCDLLDLSKTSPSDIPAVWLFNNARAILVRIIINCRFLSVTFLTKCILNHYLIHRRLVKVAQRLQRIGKSLWRLYSFCLWSKASHNPIYYS